MAHSDPVLAETKAASSGQLRTDDALKFLDVYRHLENLLPQNRQSLREVLNLDIFKPFTTTLGQLQRVSDYFLGSVTNGEGSGIDRLFKMMSRSEGIRPTKEAQKLEKLLSVYATFSIKLRDQFVEEMDLNEQLRQKIPVKLGCPETLGRRLLCSAFSDWASMLPNIDLEITIDNSHQLMPKLHAGLLHLVIAFGPDDGLIPETKRYDITFSSFGYPSRMCLLCHPNAELWVSKSETGKALDASKNINSGYWKRISKAKDHKERKEDLKTRAFDKLASVQLDCIDFQRTTLIVVPSWGQPIQIEECVARVKEQNGNVRVVQSYDEALTLVRMNLGVAVASEVFSKRDHITAFQLTPEKSFTRWIGVHYNNKSGVSTAACQVAELVRRYIWWFGTKYDRIRKGETPAFGDSVFKAWCDNTTKTEEWKTKNWLQLAQQKYPKNAKLSDLPPIS
jgi:DNA-binding transcriptional LysR family regulator